MDSGGRAVALRQAEARHDRIAYYYACEGKPTPAGSVKRSIVLFRARRRLLDRK